MRRTLPAFLLALLACTPRPFEPEPAGAAPTLFVAGQELGYLEPCGCTRPQLGGLARKGSATAGATLLENGGLVDRPGRLNEIKYETFLIAFSRIGCRALNVGAGDLALGLDFLRSASGLAGFPILSANLRDERGRPVFPPSVTFELEGSRFLVIGALEPALAPNHHVVDPGPAVAEALAGTPKGVRVILLFHGREEAARLLAERFPRIETVVFARSGGEPAVRSRRLLSPGDRSRWMVRLGESPAVVELSEEIPDHGGMVRVVREYVRRVASEDLLHHMNPLAPPEDGGFVGDRGCAACHAEASRVHQASRHARAIEVLARTGREGDPDCVGCHVVGYGKRTGFTSLLETPGLARVGCESCHGPAADHAGGAAVHPRGNAKESCLRCHTADTDPHFDTAEKWPKIRH